MPLRFKVLLVGINIACFIATLLIPSSVTPFAILPTIIAAMTWLFTSQSADIKQNRTAHRCVIIYTVIIALCLLTGFLADLRTEDSIKGIYYFVIKPGVLVIGNSAISYIPFALIVGLPTMILMIIEVIADFESQRKYSKPGTPINKTFEQALEKINE